MAVSVNYNLGLAVDETQNMGDGAGDVTFSYSSATAGKIDASTSVKAEYAFSDTFQLVAGTYTLHLHNMVGPLASVVNFTDKKVLLVKIACPITNTDPVLVTKSAGTPYNLFGEDAADADRITVEPGETYLAYHPETLAVVAVGERSVDFTSADLTADVTIELVAGVT